MPPARSLLLALTLLPLALPSAGRAQEGSFAFQLRGGWTAPVSDFRRGDGSWQGSAGQGPNFSIGFTFPAPGPLGAYLGFGQRLFECDPSVCPEGEDWTATGFDVALRWVVGDGGLRGWLQGGLHTSRLEGKITGPSGKGTGLTSDGGSGIEVGLGALVSIGRRTSLVPGIHYGWGRVPFPERPSVRLRYIVFDLGILMGF